MTELRDAARKVVQYKMAPGKTWGDLKEAITELARILEREDPKDPIELSDGRWVSNQAYLPYAHDLILKRGGSSGRCAVCGDMEWGTVEGARLHWRYVVPPDLEAVWSRTHQAGPSPRHPLAL